MAKKYSKVVKREHFSKQMNELKGTIEDKIADFLENSEKLKTFISFRRDNFRSYSLNNSLLIYKQCPEASYIAGYNKWKQLGYVVKRGSKALNILIPLICKDKEDKDKIYGFKKGNVFDISQVEATKAALELPTIDTSIRTTKDTLYAPKRLLEGVREYIEQFCSIVEDRDLGQAMGMTDGKQIYLKPTKNRVDMAGVLIHEFYHLHNHYKENRKELTKDLKETEAELCTLIFGSYFNLSVEGTYKYLSMYREGRDLGACFEKAYDTFSYVLDGSEKERGLEWILENQVL